MHVQTLCRVYLHHLTNVRDFWFSFISSNKRVRRANGQLGMVSKVYLVADAAVAVAVVLLLLWLSLSLSLSLVLSLLLWPVLPALRYLAG